MSKPATAILAALLVLPLVGCGILFPSAKMRATKNTPGFKSGYSDGCSAASATSADMSADKFRDQASYDTDPNYRAGWSNGYNGCRRPGTSGAPNDNPLPDIHPGAQPY